MRRVLAALMFFSVVSSLSFSQAATGRLGGIVTDPGGALVPGVKIVVTNVDTGVENTTLTNESGSYEFQSLQPGLNYKVSASLTSFQTQTATGIALAASTAVRHNFVLKLGAAAASTVDVTAAADQVLTESTATVGAALSGEKVRDLPLVGNDIMDLMKVLPGYNASTFSSPGFLGVFDVVGGQTLDTVNVTRDGMSVTSARYSPTFYGLTTTTNINPELVGEIRLILSPVDAELGRGNSQVQIQTRSGTNRFSGSAVWNIQNTALNANTWSNNHTLQPDGQATQPNWRNTHDVTVTFGGPIVHNKTFFFVAWDQQRSNTRSLVTNTVYSDTARNGIFRYWEKWNPGNATQAVPTTFNTTNINGVLVSSGALMPSVDLSGVPIIPTVNADGTTPYTGRLMCFSVLATPITAADCGPVPAGATLGVINNATPWDPLRPSADPTGFIAKTLSAMPKANFFGAGDGLNTAAYRWLRGTKGSGSALFGANSGANTSVGVSDFVNRKQINLKIDQNFNARNKMSGGWSYQYDDSGDFLASWPDGINGQVIRRPQVLTISVTSTLSSSKLNEARFGMSRNKSGEYLAIESGNSAVRDAAESWYLNGGVNPENGQTYRAAFTPAGGTWNSGPINFSSFPNALANVAPTYEFSDTFSWTIGRHSLRFGGTLRKIGSNGYDQYTPVPVTGGADSAHVSRLNDSVNTTDPISIANFAQLTAFPVTARGSSANLLYFENGSVSTASMLRWIDDPTDVPNAHWEDVSTGRKTQNQLSTEWSAFVKDDWKLTKNLTLSLGLTYDYFGSPYIESGFTSTARDQGFGLFGPGRPTTDGQFDKWLQPGNTFLTNYGSTGLALGFDGAALTGPTALTCVPGKLQANMPSYATSNCEPSLLTQIEFVGPNTPNPSKNVIPVDMNNFGPKIGFAWQLPWFGEGKTTLRGGYGINYGGAGRDGIALDTVLGGAPGATNTSSLNVTDPAIAALFTPTHSINLVDLASLVPVRPTSNPGATQPIYSRNGTFTAYDPNYSTPYTQNITMQVTRSISRNQTVDVRYVGTFGRKLDTTLNLNQPAVFDNAELMDALNVTRAGGNAPLFDQMFAGLTLASGAGIGPIGTCVNAAAGATSATVPGLGLEGCGPTQVMNHGSAHLRRGLNQFGLAGNLANGNYVGVINAIANLSTGAIGLQPVPSFPAGGVAPVVSAQILRNGCNRMANGLYNPANPYNPTAAASAANIPTRCFSEDYFYASPQFNNGNGFFVGAPSYHGNMAHNNYHSMQIQHTLRPLQGTSFQTTYTWAKLMTDRYTTYVDQRNRRGDYSVDYASIAHDIRLNGVFELPVGPNRLVLGNSSGWVARMVERWQTSLIYNWQSGSPRDTYTTAQTLYAGGGGNQPQARPDIISSDWINPEADFQWNGPNNNSGTVYGYPSPYVPFRDPQCTNNVAAIDSTGFSTFQNSCTLNGLAKVANQGDPGAILVNAGTNTWGIPLLQTALPGHQGNQGPRMIFLPGIWRLDANISKTFRITESKTVQLRIDSNNILNHPLPGEPVSNIASPDFGRVLDGGFSIGKMGSRTFQASLRFAF